MKKIIVFIVCIFAGANTFAEKVTVEGVTLMNETKIPSELIKVVQRGKKKEVIQKVEFGKSFSYTFDNIYVGNFAALMQLGDKQFTIAVFDMPTSHTKYNLELKVVPVAKK